MTSEAFTPPQYLERAPILRPLALVAVTLALAACGGGGGDSDPLPPPGGGTGPVQAQSISGTVIDGYIAGATVNCRKAGALVATTTTSVSGAYAFNLPSGQSCDTIEASGGIDVGLTPNDPSDDVAAPHGSMRVPVPTGNAAVAGLVASPLSTLVQALVDAGSTPEAAQAQVKTSLGLPSALDLLHTDPAGDAALYKANNVAGQLIDQLVDALAAAGGIGSASGLAALADAATDALAAKLSTLTLAGLTQAPDAPHPCFAVVRTGEAGGHQREGRARRGHRAAEPQPGHFRRARHADRRVGHRRRERSHQRGRRGRTRERHRRPRPRRDDARRAEGPGRQHCHRPAGGTRPGGRGARRRRRRHRRAGLDHDRRRNGERHRGRRPVELRAAVERPGHAARPVGHDHRHAGRLPSRPPA
ncbi:MAG: hypothetical protein M5U30_10970 [Burkholderiaceae bacterium]|nr:hypothetical protein [Burkholderiaceae bacterium]